MEINKKEVGQRIRETRQILGLSMEKFGKLIDDLPRSTVNNWERGINLPKLETLNRISEIGNVTNEYLLYGNQEDEYIMNLLKKKMNEVDPRIAQFIVKEIESTNITDKKLVEYMINFFVDNMQLPSEKDYLSFQLVDEEKDLYICSNNLGKSAKFYMRYDKQTEYIHIMPFTFSEHSISRLMVFLTNQESFEYWSKNLDEEMLKKTVILYFLNDGDNQISLYPLTYADNIQAYHFEATNFELVNGKLYYPFIQEVTKLKLLNDSAKK